MAEVNEITIPYRYRPRDYQRALYNCIADGYRRAVAIWHRRAGKDKTMINIVAKEMFQRVGTYFYFLPTYTQGKKIIWNGIDKDGFRFLDHIPPHTRESTNNTDMMIKLTNGSVFQVVGSDKIDSIVGTNPIGAVFSEYSLQDPRGWDFIRPIMLENGGWAIFNYTPRGHNHGYKMYDMALHNDNWFCELLSVEDTRVLSASDIQEERESGMPEEMIRQEYYCSFESTMPGAYYSEEINRARESRRICPIPHLDYLPVHTAWDLGVGKGDDMVVWFFQVDGFQVRFIDLYWNSGKGLRHYKEELDKRKHYRYGTHLAPHDIERPQHTAGAEAKTIREIAEDVGISFVKVPRVADVRVGVEHVRSKFSSLYFDSTNCAYGINALSSYRREWDSKNGVFKLMPVHDWSSHFADGIRTAVLGLDLIEGQATLDHPHAQGSYESLRNQMLATRNAEYGHTSASRNLFSDSSFTRQAS